MRDVLITAMSAPRIEDETIAALAAWQADRMPGYRALFERRGFSPGTMQHCLEIPAVFTCAFKRYPLFAGSAVAHEFRTSGTSGASAGIARFSADGLDVMREAIRVNAQRMLFPDGRETTVLVLAPSPEDAPHMIMAWGMREVVRHFGSEGSGFFVGPDGLDVPRLLAVLEKTDRPVTLIGASFGFVHLVDALERRGWSTALPEGSRLMDAGGFKGRSREVSATELRSAFSRVFGIAPDHHVNLLGMTELSSQFYDSTLASPDEPRRKVNPPWTATRAMDPFTLAPLPEGEVGLLRHLDLANLDRPLVIQTDDLGRTVSGGFEVLGRAVNDADRGCSITVDALAHSEAS